MLQSEIIELGIGLVFVWFLLSMLLTVINEALVLVFRIRAKNLWIGVGRLINPAVVQHSQRLWDTVWRLPFKRDHDFRPQARAESASDPNVSVRAVGPKHQLAPQLQAIYDSLAPVVNDISVARRRSKLTKIPADVFADAVMSLAASVHPNDLVNAARQLNWIPERVTLLESSLASASTPTDVMRLTEVLDLDLGDVGDTDKRQVYITASEMFTARDLGDYFHSNPQLAAIVRNAAAGLPVGDATRAAKAAVAQYFDREMEQVSALYQRQSRKVLAILAFGVVLFFQANSLGIISDLRNDSALREAVANDAVATASAKTLDQAVAQQCEPSGSTTTTTVAGATTTVDPYKAAVEKFACAGKIVESAKSLNLLPDLDVIKRDKTWSFGDAWHYVAARNGLLGRAITLVALTFGSQFWFDILRRMVGLKKTLSGGSGSG